MANKTIAGRDTATRKRNFEPGAGPGPGGRPPDPGDLRQPRQSGSGRKPPDGQEKARPQDTGRSGA